MAARRADDAAPHRATRLKGRRRRADETDVAPIPEQRPADPPSGAEATLEAQLADLERLRSSSVESRLARAREIERATASTGGLPHQRARLIVADMLQRQGDVAQGARLATDVHAWAEATGHRGLQARAHLVLSSVFEGIGDTAAGLDHAVRSIDLLDDQDPTRERGVHLLRLADALAATETTDKARERYLEAEQVFAQIGDEYMRVTVLNNLAFLECDLGEAATAVAAAERLRAAAEADDALNADIADTVARAYLVAGRLDDALSIIDVGRRLLQEQGDSQASTPADLALTHAEVLLAAGEPDLADERVEECLRVCGERGLDGVRVQALAVQAEVFAARGDFESAYRTHRTFHAEGQLRRSRQQEAAARARQALFETAEARREAERFRAQARTDPLTGIPNRRFVDERLPHYLSRAAGATDDGAAAVLVAAVVDVDHFKRVNDTFSHDVGDQVLRRLAGCLTAAADGTGDLSSFAARLGGEEFVIVRWDDSPAAAAAALERLRRAVQSHPWHELAPRLQVTISIGTALARPDDTQQTLLSRADAHLYAAKAAGRNRVISDLEAARTG
ncbi:MAG: GGDEF domain-containing protein [Kineosporiaceae bacterium]|nr:GGDEF domain-containing protein [Kineosporiaceae bacterium]